MSAGVILVFRTVSADDKSVSVIPIEESKDLIFTNQYDKDALLVIPAAYTNEDGTIQGEYRIDGKTYGTPSLKEEYRFILQTGLSCLEVGAPATVFSRQYL